MSALPAGECFTLTENCAASCVKIFGCYAARTDFSKLHTFARAATEQRLRAELWNPEQGTYLSYREMKYEGKIFYILLSINNDVICKLGIMFY